MPNTQKTAFYIKRVLPYSRVFREGSKARATRNSSSDGCLILQLWTNGCVAKILAKMMGEETAV